MRLGVRRKLVLLSLGILVVVSFGFTLLQLGLSRTLVEDDLRDRAVAFAQEISATIGDRREFESGALLQRQIAQIMAVRPSVLQLDILAFTDDRTTLITSSHPSSRLPFTRPDVEQIRKGGVLSRFVREETRRYWEVMAPVRIEGAVAGAVAARFSLERADALSARIRIWAFVLTAVSVLLMGSLMTLAVHIVVNRPIGRFMDAIRGVQRGDTIATVDVATGDEFGVLARRFNTMMGRINAFHDELQIRVGAATRELEARYQDVERLHQLLFATQRRLGHAERLALSGQIMAEVAHEIGTPLHSVAGHLELVRRDLPTELVGGSVERRLRVIESQVARVTEIIAQLLDLTRRAPGEAERVDLNRLVRDTVDLVRPGLTVGGLTLELATAPALPPVRGHGNQLQQVVLNLVTNAIDATPAGGSIRVATRSVLGAGEVELEISDTGRGIPSVQRKEIFEPFFSTKESGRGTGLGLFISARIVREHNGSIDVVSEEGCGASFRVRLPAGEPP